MEIIKLSGVILWLVFVIFLLDRLALLLEKKGWIYYRKRPRSGSVGLGNALVEFHSLFEHDVKNPDEMKQELQQNESESGDPPFDLPDWEDIQNSSSPPEEK